jgi:transposase
MKRKYDVLREHLDECALRICAAADAEALGRGGISKIARASGLSRTTIHAGLRELRQAPERTTEEKKHRVRRAGGGRKKAVEKDATLLSDLERLVDPVTRGDPESPLCWTCKSTEKLANELRSQGHKTSQRSVWRLLHELGYSMQSNRKSLEGGTHPDRDAQFRFIARKVNEFQAGGDPVISVDAKKKELIGRYKNGGREWHKKGQPEEVEVYDFLNKEFGKVVPYGVYDVTRNRGWVSVGISYDTAEFAVATIRRWWWSMGKPIYPEAKDLLITADGGGSNGVRVRLWKVRLQQLASDLGLRIHVCHFPPGTSKWNKIEHRMFSYISGNWRGRPLRSRAVVVNLISSTRTDKGLEIQAELDESVYAKGIKVSDRDMAALKIVRDPFHGEWNYWIAPRSGESAPL